MHFLEFKRKFSLLNEEEREFICKLSLKDAISFLKTIYWYIIFITEILKYKCR